MRKRTNTFGWTCRAIAPMALLIAAGCAGDETDAAANPPMAMEMPVQAEMEPATPVANETIVDLAVGTPDLSTLVTAVQAADLAGTLSGEGPFTVFAPVNAAFEALPAGAVESLLEPANREQLRGVLTYHVVPGRIMSSDLTDGAMVTTVEGTEVTIDLDGGPSVNGASIVTADIEASNGVVHLIDEVLMP